MKRHFSERLTCITTEIKLLTCRGKYAGLATATIAKTLGKEMAEKARNCGFSMNWSDSSNMSLTCVLLTVQALRT